RGSGGDDPESGDGNLVDMDSEESSGPVDGEGVGTTLEVADGTSATYRGAVVHRTDTDMASNPVRTTVYAAFDVTIPEDEGEFFSFEGFTRLSPSIPILDLDVSPLEPCENPASPLPQYNFGQGLSRQQFAIDGPVTITFVYCFSRAGSEIPPDQLGVAASLYHADGSERATLAVAGADLDDDALADVASSIAWLHDNVDPTALYTDERSEWEPNVFGQATFDRYYGEGLENIDTVGQAVPGAADEPGDGVDAGAGAGATIAPPPPPVDASTIDELRAQGFDDGYADGYASGSLGEDRYLDSYDDPDPSVGEYDVAYDDGYDTGLADGEAAAGGGPDASDPTDTTQPPTDTEPTTETPAAATEYPLAYGPADDDFAEFEIVRSMVEGMQTEAYEFQDCSVTPAGYPCIDVGMHTHNGGLDHRMVTSIRLGAGTEQWDRDLWLLITNADPTTEPWIVVEEWWVGDGDQPGWAM
ncbi:MAG: hypothetical protein CL424_07300, partial [Acidimicrobiaceae bacterium]|nr:hypothetical protein [Acidimicrobiaceae bacterium]